jgi:putative ABC transport system permease protein
MNLHAADERRNITAGSSFLSFESIRRDIRFAARSLLKAPGFTVIAILVIAVGIGANTAVFSVINTVLLKPLTYPDPQSLVQLMNTGDDSDSFASVPKFNIWQQQKSIFQHVAAYDTGGAGLNLTGNDQPEQVQGAHVSADYFATLGAPVIAGRTFTSAEDSPHGGNVTVLSYGLWKRRYGGNRDIVGNNIQLNGQPYQVVGVIGREFVTSNPADLWLPFQFELSSTNPANYFEVIARLKPGVTASMANAQLKLAADQFRTTYPGRLGPNNGFGVILLQEEMVRDTRSSLYVLLGAVGLVLLIACANVANLLLIRATSRKRELATRSALGAGRWHIVRQLLTESLVISLSGGMLGLLLGFAGVRFLLAINPGSIPRIGENGSAVTVDLNVLLFTLAVSLLTGILFGLVPAISSSRKNLAAVLNESSNRAGVGFRSGKTRSLLVVTEMALALVLVIGAALLIRTFMKLQSVDPGYDTHNVLTMTMSISGDRFLKTSTVAQVIHDGAERINAVPGVTTAAAACCLPLQGGFGLPFNIVGRANGNSPTTGGAEYLTVSWSYFDVFKVPVLRGRSFSENDNGAAPGVVIINQTMARQFWPKSDPLNDHLEVGAGMGPVFAEPPRQIIGVVGDMRDAGLDQDPGPTMYIPVAQMPDKVTELNSRIAPLSWIVRTRTEPHILTAAVTKAIREATGGLPVAPIRSMDEIVVVTTSRQRFNMLLLSVFGSSALLMAAIGIYGLMAYSVQQRTQELGVRMALGAQSSNIRNMVIRQGMLLAGIGLVIGIAGAFWLTEFLTGFLFGVQKWDPLAFILTPIFLCAVALMAVWLPARKATRVDPMSALRFE